MTTTYADPDLRTTPAGSYRHPRQYATVTPGPPPPPSPAHRLRQWRHQHGLTQRQAGTLAGCRARQISRMERGIDPVPPALLARLGITRRNR